MMKEKNMRKGLENPQRFIINCLVFTAVVFSALSCDHGLFTPQDVPGLNAPQESAPSGYGKVRVVFSAGQARTVFPSTVFDNYEYFFTKSGGSQQTLTPDASGVFTLETGNYTLVVKGYAGAVSANNIAATGTASFTLTTATQTVQVKLTADKISGDGKFTLSITYPTSATPTISLTNFADNTAVTPAWSTSTSGASSVISGTVNSIPAGAYLLIVKLQEGENYAGLSEVVYITPLLTTPYSKVFTAADLINAKPLYAADFNVSGTGTFTYDGSQKSVTVTDKNGKTTGAVTVYYEGGAGTSYPRSVTPPVNAGTYVITVQVTAVEGWKSESALPLGQLVINKASGAAVGTPAVSTVTVPTYTSITVNTVTAPANGQTVEYAISTSSTVTPTTGWQAGTTFTGRNPYTTYYVYARSVSNTNYLAGTASMSAGIKTRSNIFEWSKDSSKGIVDPHTSSNNDFITSDFDIALLLQEGYTNISFTFTWDISSPWDDAWCCCEVFKGHQYSYQSENASTKWDGQRDKDPPEGGPIQSYTYTFTVLLSNFTNDFTLQFSCYGAGSNNFLLHSRSVKLIAY
jgi:hypothetical protein